MNNGKGINVVPKVIYYVCQIRNMGWPKRREPHGHGVSIVVVGLTPHQGERESRSQGEGRQVGFSLNIMRSEFGVEFDSPSILIIPETKKLPK